MKPLVKQITTAAVFAFASSAAYASPSVDQSGYFVGKIETAPLHLDLTEADQTDIGYDNDGENTLPRYVEDAADPLVQLPRLVWTFE